MAGEIRVPGALLSTSDTVAWLTPQATAMSVMVGLLDTSPGAPSLWSARSTTESGGQQQRLCIARTIATKPDVILMDEPCSALDPIATARVEELIHELKKDYTIVIVTHNMQQATRVSDKTAFFYLGELVEYDSTGKMFSNPSVKQTEDYITGRFG